MTNNEIEDINETDLIYEAHDKLDALINVLIAKNIITEHEYNAELQKIYESVQAQED